MDADVLVVGAGPTGLMMGVELRRRGVSARVIDSLPEPSPLSKALVVHARSLEILADMGLADALIARGLPLGAACMRADGKLLVRASFEELDTRFPYALSVPQCDTEAVLAARLGELGPPVERAVTLTTLVQDADGVTATLRHRDGREETVRVAWLVGADGAHSVVRQQVGLDFDGEAFPEGFLLADVRLEGEWPRDEISTFFAPDGILACFPLPGGRWRLIASAPPGDAVDDRSPPTLELVQSIIAARSGLGLRASDPAWMARFGIHARQVKQYRVGRVFLAGDAAHIHSPVGGQGMNTGLQDAHNLAWKLALVQRGEGRARLLDSYHAERHAIGASLLRATDLATRVATLRHPLARAVRDSVASFMASLEVVQERITRQTAELDLSYAKSPIVAERRPGLLEARLGAAEAAEDPNLRAWRRFAAAPAAGARVPEAECVDAATGRPCPLSSRLDGRVHTLLLFDGRAATDEGYRHLDWLARRVRADHGALVRVHIVVPRAERPAALDWDGSLLLDPEGELEDRFGASAECLYLVRPDLYVGYRSQPADEAGLMEYLRGIFV